MDAIEEAPNEGRFHEIILATLPRHLSHWLHVDLPERLHHLGLPLTTVIVRNESPSGSRATRRRRRRRRSRARNGVGLPRRPDGRSEWANARRERAELWARDPNCCDNR